MNVQPDKITVSDTQRRQIRHWLGKTGMVTRQEVRDILATMWATFMHDVKAQAKSSPKTKRKRRRV